MEIVVARYSEDLEWMKGEPFNRYPCIVYNKGPNDIFYHSPELKEIIPLKNVGRDAHTILYHIVSHYDNLAEITIFLPGSSEIDYKLPKAIKIIEECEKHGNTVFIANNYHPDGVHKALYDFQIDDYASTQIQNKSANPENKLLPAEIRPYGKWHDERFPGVVTQYVSWNCILGMHKRHILQHPKSYYENLIRELETHSNPEVGHYYERSWMSVFHPMTDAVVI